MRKSTTKSILLQIVTPDSSERLGVSNAANGKGGAGGGGKGVKRLEWNGEYCECVHFAATLAC